MLEVRGSLGFMGRFIVGFCDITESFGGGKWIYLVSAWTFLMRRVAPAVVPFPTPTIEHDRARLTLIMRWLRCATHDWIGQHRPGGRRAVWKSPVLGGDNLRTVFPAEVSVSICPVCLSLLDGFIYSMGVKLRVGWCGTERVILKGRKGEVSSNFLLLTPPNGKRRIPENLQRFFVWPDDAHRLIECEMDLLCTFGEIECLSQPYTVHQSAESSLVWKHIIRSLVRFQLDSCDKKCSNTPRAIIHYIAAAALSVIFGVVLTAPRDRNLVISREPKSEFECATAYDVADCNSPRSILRLILTYGDLSLGAHVFSA